MFLLPISIIYLLVSVHDIAFRKIPDTFPILISTLGLAILVINGDWFSAVMTMGLASITFLLLAILCMAGKIGGGDVKLVAASVLLVGAGYFLDFLLLTALAGGVVSLVYLTASLILKFLAYLFPTLANPPSYKRSKNRLNLLWQIERRRILRLSSIPYGVAISGGSLLTLTLMAN